MATTIFFTESRDFKLIKDRILNHEDYYLVYVYADTTNIRIPKELIKELPIYGNNLIWVDTAYMDSSDISHHIVLTIGQLVDPEEEINFAIVSRSAKLERTIIFLRNQGIPAELISGDAEEIRIDKTKKTGKRGRPTKAGTVKPVAKEAGKKRGRPKKEAAAIVEAVPAETKKRGRKKKAEVVMESAPKRRGRPKKEAAAVITEAVPQAPKKKGRPAKEKPVKEKKIKESVKNPAKKVKAPKEKKAKVTKAKKVKVPKEKKVKAVKGPKSSKPRNEKTISAEDIASKLIQYKIEESNASLVLSGLFGMKKVQRPKLIPKLVDMITRLTLEDETVAERMINQMQNLGIIEVSGTSGKILYKD